MMETSWQFLAMTRISLDPFDVKDWLSNVWVKVTWNIFYPKQLKRKKEKQTMKQKASLVSKWVTSPPNIAAQSRALSQSCRKSHCLQVFEQTEGYVNFLVSSTHTGSKETQLFNLSFGVNKILPWRKPPVRFRPSTQKHYSQERNSHTHTYSVET